MIIMSMLMLIINSYGEQFFSSSANKNEKQLKHILDFKQ